MDNQNNYYPQQPQYIDPQAYTPAPLIPDQPQPAAPAEPEVILQEVGFADYGFGEGDSVTTGHDFGNIMLIGNSILLMQPEDKLHRQASRSSV